MALEQVPFLDSKIPFWQRVTGKNLHRSCQPVQKKPDPSQSRKNSVKVKLWDAEVHLNGSRNYFSKSESNMGRI
jgi:hypothetical protein